MDQMPQRSMPLEHIFHLQTQQAAQAFSLWQGRLAVCSAHQATLHATHVTCHFLQVHQDSQHTQAG